MQPQPPSAPVATPPSSRPADERRSLSRITWYAVLNLAENVVGAVMAAAVFSTFFSAGLGFIPGISIAASGPLREQQLQAIIQVFQYLIVLEPVTLVLGLVSLALLWTGFRGLSKAGAHEFSTPSKLVLVSVVAWVLLMPGALTVFSSMIPLLASLIQRSGAAPAAPAASLLGSILLLGVILVVIGGLLLLTGTIGGAILGLWRVGGRYGQAILKVGAILLIVPFLSIVSPILVIIGVSDAKGKIGQAKSTS